MSEEDKKTDQPGTDVEDAERTGGGGDRPVKPSGGGESDVRRLAVAAALLAVIAGGVKVCDSLRDDTNVKVREVVGDSSDTRAELSTNRAGDGVSDELSSLYEGLVCDAGPLDPLTLAKLQFGKVPRVTETQIKDAYCAVSSALKEIEDNPDLKALLNKYQVDLQSPAYYMAIALKESLFKKGKEAVSESGRKGYFQLTTTPGGALEDISKFFGVNFTEKDVYHGGDDESLQSLAGKNNSIGGVLYWHICRDIYLSKGFNPPISQEDKDRAVAFAYNMGPSDFRLLWNTLSPSSFFDFGIKVAGELVKQPSGNYSMTNGAEFHDDVYNSDYVSYVKGEKKPKKNKTVSIGGKDFKVAKLLQALKYTEVVYGLMGFEKQYPDQFTVRPGFKMWSIADRCISVCIKNYNIPYFASADYTRTQKIEVLFQILVAFNIGNNAPFSDYFKDVDPKNPGIEDGATVLVPDKAFVEDYLSKIDLGGEEHITVATNAALETLPKNVPLYTNDPDGKLVEDGAKILEYNEAAPKVTVPNNDKGIPLDTGEKSGYWAAKNPSGVMKYIVLHSTMGGHEGLYDSQKIHYVVRRDGRIELISDENIPVNHAGCKVVHKKTPAGWNGDMAVTFKSIGIEVETGDPNDKDPTDNDPLWNDEQYDTVNKLVHWIGARHKIPAAHVLTHSQIAYSIKYGRGRKPDPLNLDWSRLGLPTNYLRVDPDVASGAMKANIPEILREMKDSKWPWYGGDESMLVGLRAAEKISKGSSTGGGKAKNRSPKAPEASKASKPLPKKAAVLKAKSRSAPVAVGRIQKLVSG